MLFNIRSTSGSGKSTLVRRIMSHYDDVNVNYQDPEIRPRRRRPISYLFNRKDGASLFVPGHYEIPCGGCDTIKTVPQTYGLIQHAIYLGHDALFEGIMLGDDVNHTTAFAKANPDVPFYVVRLLTDVKECLTWVQKRRDERGETKRLDPTNTETRAKRAVRNCDRLGMACKSIDVSKLTREYAYMFIRDTLGLSGYKTVQEAVDLKPSDWLDDDWEVTR